MSQPPIVATATMNQPEQHLRVRLLSDKAKLPQRATANAAGYDLFAARDVQIPSKEQRLIPTDIAVEFPPGVYGRIAPRSSLAAKHALTVHAGVIDADYRGNLQVLLFNFGRHQITLCAGDRIAQLILECHLTPPIKMVQRLSPTSRGERGWGSTGLTALEDKPNAGCDRPARQHA
ncbi:dUTPase-like protein [Thamnocephalis sphaerospora]|uniref:Deoxyuridine 5'-triphosphate nucleotidohydrolase n=1 Tax=Thamnocephalis sphaerospora TaxID=78915 RepID=A0A4V1IVU1_9FUNG|nr:dUTPase-like protein [Thamnocephalis sphaerospora]|eukprot:RKP05239.1 dUTPase-like protein [Thamnocephalis sphaerospora]